MKVYMLRNIGTGQYYKRGWHWAERDCATVWTDRKGPAAARGALTKLHRRTPTPMTDIVELTAISVEDLELVMFALQDTAVQQDELGGDGAQFRDLAEKLI